MLSDSQCLVLEKALTENVEPRKLAAYICLHMGLTVAEASAVCIKDIDFVAQTLTVNKLLSRNSKGFILKEAEKNRVLPLPPHVNKLLAQNLNFYSDKNCFLINAKTELPKSHYIQNLLVSINNKYHIAKNLTAVTLRNVFIRRCLECGIDVFTVCELVGIKQIGEIQKKYGQYLIARPQKIMRLEKYSSGYLPPKQIQQQPKRMNLLILGAGSQGAVVKEVAEAIGIFNKIAFLDDDPNNKLAIDSCEHYIEYVNSYSIALPSFGNCPLRAKWIDRLEKAGFILPTLIHPLATVSPSAVIEEGVTIETKSIIGTNAHIKHGCIISSGAVVDLNAIVNEKTHGGSAATIKKGAVVPAFSVVPSGDIFG